MLSTDGIGGGQTPTVFVSSDNPYEAQSIADQYAQYQSKNALYDRSILKVAVYEFVRAAITDGSFTIFIHFGRDLMVPRHLVASVVRLLKTIGNDGQLIKDGIS